MLDNDAALAAMLSSAGATELVTLLGFAQAPNGANWQPGDSAGGYIGLGSQAAIVAFTGVGAGFGGRVRVYRSEYEAAQDKYRQPYATPEVEIFLDMGLNDYGSAMSLDVPHIVQLYPNGAPSSIYVEFTAYGGINQVDAGFSVVLAVLAIEKTTYAAE